MIEAVLFDIDDTLYRQLEVFEATCRLFPTLAALPAEALFRARSIHGMEALRQMNAGKISMNENHIYRMVMACRDLGVPLSDRDALDFQMAYAEAQQHLTVTSGMTAVLDFCKTAGWTLGCLTNGPSDHQRHKFQILGLERWMPEDHIIVSGDCGVLKPAPEIFRFAEAKLGLSPASTLLVGDSLENDIQGAETAGWQSFWLRQDLESQNDAALLAYLQCCS